MDGFNQEIRSDLPERQDCSTVANSRVTSKVIANSDLIKTLVCCAVSNTRRKHTEEAISTLAAIMRLAEVRIDELWRLAVAPIEKGG